MALATAGPTPASARTYDVSASYATKLGGGASMDVTLEAALTVVRPAGAARGPAIERLELSRIDARASKSAPGAGAAGGGDPFPGLGQPVFVERGRDGEPRRIGFAAGVPRGTRQLVEFLVAELQVVGARAGATAWTRSERDTSGRYRADYRRVGVGQLRKIKRAYDPVPQRPAVSVLASDRALRIGTDGALEDLRAEERLRIAEVGSETSSRLRVKATGGVDQRPGDWRPPPNDAVWFEFGTANAISDRERDDAALAGQQLEAVMEAVRTKTGSDLFKALLQLAAFLRRDPAVATAAVARAADADGAQSELPRLVTALLDAGTLEADALVARWLNEKLGRAERVSGQLLLRHAPHPALVQALLDAAADHARPDWRRAVFALGAGASLLRASDSAAARRLVSRLLSDEAAAAGDERTTYLGALGATGDAGAFARLAARVRSPDGATAQTAAAGLGHFETRAATGLLDDVASRAADPRTRQAAARACGRRAPELSCHTLATIAVKDRDAEVRRAAVDSIASGGGRERQVVLRRVQDRDPDPGLRQYAAQKLTQLESKRAGSAIDWKTARN